MSQVRLGDAVNLSAPILYKFPSGMAAAPVHIHAMSFDILIVDSEGQPKIAFEADGKYHPNSTWEPSDEVDAQALAVQKARQGLLDDIKDEIATKAGILLIRVEVDGLHPHIDVVRAMLNNYPGFSRELGYPTDGQHVQYDATSYPDARRILELEDLELKLVENGWKFPDGWEFVTDYDLRHFLPQQP